MRHFIKENGVIHGYEDNQLQLVTEDMRELDAIEFEARTATKPSQFHVWDEGNLKWIDPRADEEILQHTRENMPKLNQREFRKLLRDNNLFDQAKAFIYSSGNGYLEDAWEYSEYFTRTDPLLIEAMLGLSLTDEQVDAIWLSVK